MPKRKTKTELACIRHVRRSCVLGGTFTYKTIAVSSVVYDDITIVGVFYRQTYPRHDNVSELRHATCVKIPGQPPYIVMDAIIRSEGRWKQQ